MPDFCLKFGWTVAASLLFFLSCASARAADLAAMCQGMQEEVRACYRVCKQGGELTLHIWPDGTRQVVFSMFPNSCSACAEASAGMRKLCQDQVTFIEDFTAGRHLRLYIAAFDRSGARKPPKQGRTLDGSDQPLPPNPCRKGTSCATGTSASVGVPPGGTALDQHDLSPNFVNVNPNAGRIGTRPVGGSTASGAAAGQPAVPPTLQQPQVSGGVLVTSPPPPSPPPPK